MNYIITKQEYIELRKTMYDDEILQKYGWYKTYGEFWLNKGYDSKNSRSTKQVLELIVEDYNKLTLADELYNN